MDYIKAVKKNRKLWKVVVRWGNKTNTFIKKGKNYIRLEKKSIAPNRIIRLEMEAQVRAILFPAKKNAPQQRKKPKTIPTRNLNGQERERVEMLKESKAEITADGRLLFTDSGGTLYLYSDIEKAIRAQGEIIVSLTLEREDLIQTVDTIKTVISQLLKKKNPDLSCLNPLLFKFEYCTEIFKVLADEALADALVLEDSLGRKNPSAMRAKLIPVQDLIQARINAIPRIVSIIGKRREVYARERVSMLNNINRASAILTAILRSRNLFFRNKPVFNAKLEDVEQLLKSVWILPFQEEAKRCIKYINKTKKSKETAKQRGMLTHARGLLQIITNHS